LRDSIFPVILDEREMELCRCICIGICRGMLSTRGPWVVPPPLTYRGEERTEDTRYLASPTYIPCKNLRDSIFPVILCGPTSGEQHTLGRVCCLRNHDVYM